MDPLNLILLIIVALVGWRLRSVLGTRNDDERPGSRADAYRLNRHAYEHPPEPLKPIDEEPSKPADAPLDETVDETAGEIVDETAGATSDGTASEELIDTEQRGRGLAYLREIDPSFDEAGFLDGAARAYEMILTAFANDELAAVQGFLGDEVAAGFEAAIAARQAAGQKLETRILRLDRPALDDAEVEGDKLRLDVRLRAEIISASYAADSTLDEDNLPAPTTSVDIWSFEGAHNSANPNWQLVATRAD
jgi:predicted lipid-binding transport protein (Tim44 family)